MTARARFDVAAYVRAPIGPMRDSLTGLGETLPADLADALRYVQRRAQGTTSWLARVLVTATHKDARITAFLSTWAYEAHWLGDAVGAIAGAGSARAAAIRRGPGQWIADRFGPLREAVVANLHGGALTGVQMTERLVDGWMLDAMLERAQSLAPAGAAEDLARVREAIARQGRFFAESASEALAGSRAVRVLARRRLARRAWPIGAEHEPASATAAALKTLFDGDRSWAAALDRRIDQLPGLHGLALARRTAARPGRPALRTTVAAALRRAPHPTGKEARR